MNSYSMLLYVRTGEHTSHVHTNFALMPKLSGHQKYKDYRNQHASNILVRVLIYVSLVTSIRDNSKNANESKFKV